MTNDEILKRGAIASRLLGDEDLMWFFNDLLNDIKTASFNTSALQRDEREALYFQHSGLEDVLSRMNSFAQNAQELLERLNNPEETYDD